MRVVTESDDAITRSHLCDYRYAWAHAPGSKEPAHDTSYPADCRDGDGWPGSGRTRRLQQFVQQQLRHEFQRPSSGGTLKLVAASGPDHIDTVPAYYTADYILERGYARQLLTYPTAPGKTLTSAGWTKNTTPVPDVATAVPTTANGGITNGGKTYTFHLKQGVDWNTSPPRQVIAADFIREFKAFCNPVSPVGNPLYYTATIAGLKQYCDCRDEVLRRQDALTDGRQHRQLPEHSQHLGHHGREFVDAQVQPDPAGR